MLRKNLHNFMNNIGLLYNYSQTFHVNSIFICLLNLLLDSIIQCTGEALDKFFYTYFNPHDFSANLRVLLLLIYITYIFELIIQNTELLSLCTKLCGILLYVQEVGIRFI